MFGMTSPIWLTALITIPLIWWLHHCKPMDSSVTVSSLSLWKNPINRTTAFSHRGKTDPLWTLRAIVATLLIIALTGPYRSHQKHFVEIWVDDSFSLQTREDAGERRSLAIHEVLRRLNATRTESVRFHSLHRATQPVLQLDPSLAALSQSQLDAWLKPTARSLRLPLLVRFSKNAEHWLISDGSSLSVNEWAQTHPFTELIRVGEASENSSVTRLAVRPSLVKPGRWQALAHLHHFGRQTSQRTVELLVNRKRQQTWTVEMHPEQVTPLSFNIDDLDDATLTLRFAHPDVLPQDDQLELGPLSKIPTRIYGACPRALLAAIQSHPALTLSSVAKFRTLKITCGNDPVQADAPIIYFHRSPSTTAVTGNPVWITSSLDSAKPQLQRNWIRSVSVAKPKNKHVQAVLAENTNTLVSVTASEPRKVDCYIDMDHADFVRQAEYAAFFAVLVDLAFSDNVLDNIYTAQRRPTDSRIESLNISKPAGANSRHLFVATDDLTPIFLASVIFLLLLDLFLTGKRRRVGFKR